MSSLHTDAVAIQLIAVKQPKTFCLAYDLRNVNNKEMLEYPGFIGTTNNCRMIFQDLVKIYPPKMVKSIFTNFNVAFQSDDKVGKEVGYLNINWVPDFAAFLTTELLMEKIQIKK
uniref:Uncharacterized protein n=1 Tax=Panagrolaimus sp. JU765 TaxID=591449 RepID=A0AC34Q7A0_9BILA